MKNTPVCYLDAIQHTFLEPGSLGTKVPKKMSILYFPIIGKPQRMVYISHPESFSWPVLIKHRGELSG
jgi:hypothetical protein